MSEYLKKNGYIPKADTTLMGMKKKELIELIRCLEHNWDVALERNEVQYEQLMDNKYDNLMRKDW